ncbi:MAG TPA: MFS transporter [Chthoniobacterales bacterium]|nr:MFS transporter [Chthoniobacterales bacterium]
MSSTATSSDEGRSGRGMLTKAVIASTVGTAIEWYDFFLYGTAAGLVFGKEYFPSADPNIGTLSAFGTYAVGFVARPVGAAIFGHFGDRIGRKAALIWTLLLMGIATMLVAFVPGYSQIGIWGGVILTVLRFIQGVGVGGEWGGSVLLAMEWAKTNKSRGLITSWPQFGVPVGLFLSTIAMNTFSGVSGAHFFEWGWRIPFLLSGILIIIGLWIRLGILETPVFARLTAENKLERTPVLEVIKRQPKSIVLSALVRLAEQTPFYIFTAFIIAYATGQLKLDRNLVLNAVLAFACVEFFTIPLAGYLSDKIGRKRMYLIGAGFAIVFGFIYFGLLGLGNTAISLFTIVLGAFAHSMVYGPQAALIAEQFTPRMRYSGSSIGYQLASVIAGGPAPLIAQALFIQFHSGTPIAIYMSVCAIVAFLAALGMTEYAHRDIHEEYAHVGRGPTTTIPPAATDKA